MSEPRKLTATERKAVDRLEKALAAIPDTLVLYFNEGGFDVFDPDDWEQVTGSLAAEELALTQRNITCHYDTGAL